MPISPISATDMTAQTTTTPITAADIADYFIYLANDIGSISSFISNLKLQKLVYYAQAWHLALYDTPLFEEDFEAWAHGPVIPALFDQYKSFQWRPIVKGIKEPEFSQELSEFLDEVTEVYFFRDGFELEMMVHREDPWIKAREGLPMAEDSDAIISKESMKQYYKSRAE